MNLAHETVEALEYHGKTTKDVLAVAVIGTSRWYEQDRPTFWCTWGEFVAAAYFEYDSGYGGAEVAIGLVVIGDDWWLERREYDGYEWWVFKTRPTLPELHRAPTSQDLKDY